MANKTGMPVYWADLPTLLPWNYKHRTALSQAFTLQVSGRLDGPSHRAALYRITPEGRLVGVWHEKFEVRKGTAPRSARYKALKLFLEAAENDPKVARRVTIHDAVDTARAILAGSDYEEDTEA